MQTIWVFITHDDPAKGFICGLPPGALSEISPGKSDDS